VCLERPDTKTSQLLCVCLEQPDTKTSQLLCVCLELPDTKTPQMLLCVFDSTIFMYMLKHSTLWTELAEGIWNGQTRNAACVFGSTVLLCIY